MFRKILIPILIVAVAVLGVSGVAFAAGSSISQSINLPGISRLQTALAGKKGANQAAAAKQKGLVGQITSLNGNEITVQGLKGQERTFQVNDLTVYLSAEGEARSLADLKTGQWIMVTGGGQKTAKKTGQSGASAAAPLTGTQTAPAQPAGQLPTAKTVTLLPEGWAPSDWSGMRLRGHVAAVDTTKNTLTVLAGKSQERIVNITANTHFLGSASSLAALKVGMVVSVGVDQKADGTLTAAAVFAHAPLLRLGGQVTQVDTAANRFTLHLPSGEDKTVQVNAATEFRSKDGSVAGLTDLKPQMRVLVVGQQQADGTALATVIGSAGKAALPQADLRIAGRVLSINGSTLLVQARTGEQLTIQVDAGTQFRSPGNKITGLDQVKVGMGLAAGLKSAGQGQYQALYLVFGNGKAAKK